jgi:hypothetical protein
MNMPEMRPAQTLRDRRKSYHPGYKRGQPIYFRP